MTTPRRSTSHTVDLTTAHNEGFNVRVLFRITAKAGASQVFTGADKNLGGRPGTDYLVTRYVAYLIAMNDDPAAAISDVARLMWRAGAIDIRGRSHRRQLKRRQPQ